MAAALVTSLVTGALTISGNLTQSVTNGDSLLGTLQAPVLGDFLTDNPLPSGFPWGTLTAEANNPYTDAPHTGVIRQYDFRIHRQVIYPDGVQKEAIVVNGAYPGPTIEANWGDTIQVTIHNQITGPEEGTSIHWHGLLQKATPWYDGVPSVQQCPIAPGKSFTYSFKADLYGTSWWHSHYSAQYAGGLHGPMIIHGPNHVHYDVDLGPVFISDYYHREYFSLVEDIVGTVPAKAISAFNSDNNLINGKMDFNCSLIKDGTPCKANAGLAKFQFHSGKTHRLRLINSGAEGGQKFTIDNHTMTVIANDFVPVQPYETNAVTLGVGQRTDVLVKATGKATDSYWMRADISCGTTNGPNALAVVYYENANKSAVPQSTRVVDTSDPCKNDDLNKTIPVYPIQPTSHPQYTQTINITGGVNATGHFNWYMNNVSFRANYDNPLLLLASQGNESYPFDPEWNVYDFGENKTIRIVINNQFGAPHPIHIHGQNMFVLKVGQGNYDGSPITVPTNPQRRDVQVLPGFGHIVIQLNSDNPGVWPLHCHIAWHVSAGLYVNVMQRPKEVRQLQIPMIMSQTCDDWHKYSHSEVVDQIDSGLRV